MSDEVVKKHQAHCVNLLRQLMMCHAGTGVIPQFWVVDSKRSQMDFSTTHKCNNFDDILATAKASQVEEGRKLVVKLREGDIMMPTLP